MDSHGLTTVTRFLKLLRLLKFANLWFIRGTNYAHKASKLEYTLSSLLQEAWSANLKGQFLLD